MSISIMKKAAALVCGAATLMSVGAALSASAEGAAVIKGAQVTTTAGAVVQYAVSIENNPGYSSSGLTLVIPSELEVQNIDGKSIDFETGDGSKKLNGECVWNEEKRYVGWGTSGTKNCTTDGDIFIIEIKVPDNAAPGTTYPMDILDELEQFVNMEKTAQPYTVVDGWIKIEGETTTTTTATTTEEPKTTTTESMTNSEEPTTTTTLEPVSTEPGSDTTTAEPGTGDVTDSTNGSDVSETTNGNGGSDVPGPKAGEAGAALAIAGLLTAAGAAYAIRRKH